MALGLQLLLEVLENLVVRVDLAYQKNLLVPQVLPGPACMRRDPAKVPFLPQPIVATG